jgi:hypothetical protein
MDCRPHVGADPTLGGLGSFGFMPPSLPFISVDDVGGLWNRAKERSW